MSEKETRELDKARKLIEEKYESMDEEGREHLHQLYLYYQRNEEKFKKEYEQLQNVIYKKKPPTPEEFLDPRNGWIPPKEIWPHVKQDFIDILSGKKNYFQLAFYGSTRLGKSFLAVLLMMYTIVYCHHLRDPALFYGLSTGTRLAMYIISFNKSKPKEIYLDPLYDYLENAPRFERVIQVKQVKRRQKEVGLDKIVWSSADISSSGHLTLASGVTVRSGNKNPDDVIGANVIQAYISEISFFINQAGASEDDIFELYTNCYSRIRATVGKDYLTWVFLDSSANYEDSRIEKHIINNLQYAEDTYFTWRWQWMVRPWDFPKYYTGLQKLGIEGRLPTEKENKKLLKEKYVFQVITGNGSIPARLVTHPSQLKDVPPDLIDYPPIDVLQEYQNNLVKSIKDIGGKPTSNESKFIQNEKYVNNMFDDRLRNIEGGIIADSMDMPEDLIWNQIKDKFFNIGLDGRRIIYRAPNEGRFLSIDTASSYKGDLYGITMGHFENIRKQFAIEKVFVVDFSFTIMPGKNGINLTAVEKFIFDLMNKGNISLIEISSDTFQSKQTVQDLQRMRLEVKDKMSTDKSLEPYIFLYTNMVNGLVKSGRNIFLKNNLKCLEIQRNEKGREIIDHPKGQTHNRYAGDWENSICGTNAKDVSDTLAMCNFIAHNSKAISTTDFDMENRRLQSLEIHQTKEHQEFREKSYNILKGRY